ncbi:MAG: hypothetical protein LBM23_00680 [Propionibacteriaceae bacterium]|jgi:hypothetical protein|nr:hypothetical protein [Propionibacteriaceae bacterium]
MQRDLLSVAQFVQVGSSKIPFLGFSNIWVDDGLVDSKSIELVQTILKNSLELTSPGQLEIIVYDDGLTGMAAPLSALNSYHDKILRILNDEDDLKYELRRLRDHVQSVRNVISGTAQTLVDFRGKINYPVEGYKIVVVATDFSMLADETQAQLGILMKAGPQMGVSFIIHSIPLGANPYLLALCDHLVVKDSFIERVNESDIFGWTPSSSQELIAISESVAKTQTTVKMEPISFAEIQSISDIWGSSSASGITFSLGKYGLKTVEVTLGDELNQRHNVLITGAVGQGKSNLISIIIHSICQRYSPIEVNLYLLDFKEGVSLQPYFDEKNNSFLPHARVLGLEADREFGLSVLSFLFNVYRERMRKFKECGVQNLEQFRRVHPNEEMPRIVLIIDEFQLMFSNQDKLSNQIAELLISGMRLFRASGIHIILASQTIGGNMALIGSSGEGLFAQIPVRLALKNSLNESRATLGDRNDAAARLRAREAIVNLDYGELSANMKTSIAFADEEVLSPLRSRWWNMAKDYVVSPRVFKGDAIRSLDSDRAQVLNIRQNGEPCILLGATIDVDTSSVQVSFGRDMGRNVAIVGSTCEQAEIFSIAAMASLQKRAAKLYIFDFEKDSSKKIKNIKNTSIESFGNFREVRHFDLLSAIPCIHGLMTDCEGGDCGSDIIIVALGMDRFRNIPNEFRDLVKIGPSAGVHFIGWWSKYSSFKEQVGYGGENCFDVRIATRLDQQSTKLFMQDALLDWDSPENRILAWDTSEMTKPQRLIPYSEFSIKCLNIQNSTTNQ